MSVGRARNWPGVSGDAGLEMLTTLERCAPEATDASEQMEAPRLLTVDPASSDGCDIDEAWCSPRKRNERSLGSDGLLTLDFVRLVRPMETFVVGLAL